MSEISPLEWFLTLAFAAAVVHLYTAMLHDWPGPASEEPQGTQPEGVSTSIPAGGLEDTLHSIRRAGGYADLDAFVAGARLAYERIITAFAAGDLGPVTSLLAPAIHEAFAQAIVERQTRGETETMTFIGFLASEPVDAGFEEGTAWIEMRFVAQMVSMTTDRTGQVVAGDSRRIAEMSEAWTFSRETRSRDPNWTLIATREDD